MIIHVTYLWSIFTDKRKIYDTVSSLRNNANVVETTDIYIYIEYLYIN